jgi:hypothetical protein
MQATGAAMRRVRNIWQNGFKTEEHGFAAQHWDAGRVMAGHSD